jgi:hypothetical protein
MSEMDVDLVQSLEDQIADLIEAGDELAEYCERSGVPFNWPPLEEWARAKRRER